MWNEIPSIISKVKHIGSYIGWSELPSIGAHFSYIISHTEEKAAFS